MSGQDWWAKKLAAAAPAPVQQPQRPQPYSASPYWGASYPASPSPAMQPAQPTQGNAPVGAPPGGYWSYTADGQRTADDGHVAVLNDAALATGGSRRMQAANGVCPECGGGNYFARDTDHNGMPLRNPASPQCFDCGYPVVQTGSTGGTLGRGVSTRGVASKQARQLAPGHNVEVILEGGQRFIYPSVQR